MIRPIIINRAELEALLSLEPYVHDSYSYTRLARNNDKIIKLYKYDRKVNEEMISRDIESLLAVTKVGLSHERFILPSKIFVFEGRIIGYEMPYVEGEGLSSALKRTDLITAKHWFLQIYQDIQMLERLNPSFAFSDLHEENIIVDAKGNLMYCDLDGWRLVGGRGKSARYMSMQRELFAQYPQKYRQEKNTMFYYTDKTTDFLSLLVIVLNYIMGEGCFASLPQPEQVVYLRYLEQQGMPSDFMNMIKALYSDVTNYIDEKAIMSIPSDTKRFSYESFYSSTSKFKDRQAAYDYIFANFGMYAI